jgi:hypothetical protein
MMGLMTPPKIKDMSGSKPRVQEQVISGEPSEIENKEAKT